MRIFLANFLANRATTVNINELNDLNACSRRIFAHAIGLKPSHLTWREVDGLRPLMYKFLSDVPSDVHLLKVHEYWRSSVSGGPLFPPEVTRATLYIVRNPLDVATSFSHHFGCSIDKAIDLMGDEQFVLSSTDSEGSLQFPQLVGSWSKNVKSWVEECSLPVRVVRYESLLENPVREFGDIVEFLGLERLEVRVERAVQAASFEKLAQQEVSEGFREWRGNAPTRFFRKGVANAWRHVLTADQIDRVVNMHGEMMTRAGYATQGLG